MSAPKKYETTVEEAMKSMNGFDEIAIEQAFGKDFDELSGRKSVRALIFLLERRGGASDKDAKAFAMSVPAGVFDDMFDEPIEEIDADDPDTDQGKDSSATD